MNTRNETPAIHASHLVVQQALASERIEFVSGGLRYAPQPRVTMRGDHIVGLSDRSYSAQVTREMGWFDIGGYCVFLPRSRQAPYNVLPAGMVAQ